MTVDAIEEIRQFVLKILGDKKSAEDFMKDPYGSLTAQGVTDADLSGVDVRQIVGDVCGSGSVAPEMRSALQSYTSGSAGPAEAMHHVATERVVQQLSYVTNVAYQDDHSVVSVINDSSTTIDQSTNVDVEGDFTGNIDVDQVNATGDGAVAAGPGSDVTAATGAGSQAIGGDNLGMANTGDGAVQIGNAPLTGFPPPAGSGPILRDVGGVPGFGTGIGPINTGTNTGVMAGGPVDHTVVGDGNQTANVEGPASQNTFDFGGGSDSHVVGSHVGPGAAVASGGSAEGNYTESTTETTTVHATESGPGNLDQTVWEEPESQVLPPALQTSMEPVRAAEADPAD